ncbi:aldose 1-epimerase [Dictyobacter arantiisoli]|uniref:Aldose 1-epimerase n=1 Tax=Dictyobacter arantiisoli TaxID=2014874 RepID=A0A5A5TFH9_9CHLR|nr:aldose 1-epimerase [Dictyobacter arantiisoli]GCF10330.1 aldose 1-epimerase [Dictyobacter arantiisoli]
MALEHPQSPFSAEIRQDAELGSTVLSLSYQDAQDASRNLNAEIAPDLGSNLFRLRAGEHDIIYRDLALLKQMGFTGDFVLWPFPNRVRDKRYSYQGKEYSLAAVKRPTPDTVLIHGLVFDRAWQYEQPVVTATSASVTTFVDVTAADDHWYEAYPFESRLSLTYTLTAEGVQITYQVRNTGTQSLPFGFALHPYFSTLSNKQETYISLPAKAVMEADSLLLPTGRVLDVSGIMYAMFDLRQPVAVSNLKLDHVYTQLEPGAPVVVDYRGRGIQLHITSTDDFTHAVIYSATAQDPFFCIEHQTCSTDAINLAIQGEERQQMAHLLEVQPGSSATGSLYYKLTFQQ